MASTLHPDDSMTRIAGASLLFALMTATAACGVGGDDGMKTPPQPDPINDGVVCNAHFTVAGTFAPGITPRPIDPDTGMTITGCWPVGTWTFTATVDNTGLAPLPGDPPVCATAPNVVPYSFKVERTPATDGGTDTVQMITNLTSLTASAAVQVHVSMSSDGQGCEGSLEMGTADGLKYWNMKPTLSKDPAARTLAGVGDYSEFKIDAWPWKGQ